MNLDGAVVLLTGGSSGIGAATARLLAQRGSRLLLVGRDEVALERARDSSDGCALRIDLADPGAPDEVARWAIAEAGRVDVLIANAGQGWVGGLTGMPTDTIDRLVTVNLIANLRLTRALLPGMLERRRGHLVFVSSIAGCLGVAQEAVYAATKSGLRAFADSLRYETAGRGIGISVLVPGVVDTAFFSRRGKEYGRARPRPVPADLAARALAGAIELGHAEVFVPRWMRLPARLHGAMPRLVGALQRRWG